MVIFHSYVSLPEGRILEVLASNTLEHMPGTMQPKNLGPFFEVFGCRTKCAPLLREAHFQLLNCHEVPRLPHETTLRDVWNLQKWPLLPFGLHHGRAANICERQPAASSKHVPTRKNRNRVTEDCKGVKALAVTICLGISPLGFMFGV